MYKALSLIAFSALLFVICCGGKKNQLNNNNRRSDESTSIQPQQTGKLQEEGKTVYMKYCFACHQIDGSGVPGMYPPIQKSDWVSGDKVKLIKLVLEGMKGTIEVKGEEYDQAMPQHNFLTDKQVADVLTYIRNNFGNKADAITTKEVAKIRKPAPK